MYKAELIPTLWMAQSAEIGPKDAQTFHNLVYRSAMILSQIQKYSFMGGIAATAVGVALVLLSCMLARRPTDAQEDVVEEEEVRDEEAAIEMSRRSSHHYHHHHHDKKKTKHHVDKRGRSRSRSPPPAV